MIPDEWWESDTPTAAWARQIGADPDGGGCVRPPPANEPVTASAQNDLTPPAGHPETSHTVVTAAIGPPQTDTTTGTPHTGAMIALIPTTPQAYTIPTPDAEPPDALHVTLHYLGDYTDMNPATWETLRSWAEALATYLPPIQARIFGAAIWNPDSPTPSVIASIGDAPPTGDDPAPGIGALSLDQVHDAVTRAVTGVDPDWSPPRQHSPWVAHMCTSYPTSPEATMEALGFTLAMIGPLELGTLRITAGPEAHDYPLSGGRMVP